MEDKKTSLIEMKNISVEFPGVLALKNVDYSFQSGVVTALVGANGAGKSTLMKVLSGVYSHYTGEIVIDGETKEIRTPDVAKRLGIETVYQEVDTALIPNLTVAENIMVDYMIYELGKKQFIPWKYFRKMARDLLNDLGIDIDPNAIIATLSLAQKQMVVIARAVLRKCSFLILDEPTAPLSESETEMLFGIVRRLQAEGVGIIFISHRLNELFEICESLTVLRDGELIVSNKELTAEVTIADICELMLGCEYSDEIDKSAREISSELLLEAKNLSDEKEQVRNINLYVKRGEIVGLSGLVGAGKTELCKTLYGVFGRAKGELVLSGKPSVIKTPEDAVKQGMALIPEERRKEGIVIGETVKTNLSVSTLRNYTNKFGFINKKKEVDTAIRKIGQLGIKTPGPNQMVELLSGGNQQKVTIGKWIDSTADIYIFDEATKGIDVGAKQDVYNLIVKLARQGKGIIYASSEMDEIMLLTDRVYVMYNGMIQKEFVTSETTEDQLMLYSTGGKE